LIIPKLDRLSRNVAFIARLMEGKVPFLAVDMSEANELTIHILAAVAQHERRMISTRIKEALQAAKYKSKHLGNRTNLNEAQRLGAKARIARADKLASNVLPLIHEIENTGVTSHSIIG
jgi:DNA invertase Pin-like site-specific DNA recombinase